MSKFYLGLDLSLTSPGLSIISVDNRKPFLMEVVGVKTKAKDRDGKRLDEIRRLIKSVYERYTFEEVIKEKSFSRFNRETQQIYKVNGLIEWTFRDEKLPEYAPTTVKKTLTGNGRGSKEEVELAVIQRLNLKEDYFVDYKADGNPRISKGKIKKKDDLSDACAVVLTHLIKENLID